TPFTLRLSGQAVIPKPWHAVNPLANGVRIVVDGLTGPGRFDATVPGGARLNGVGWALNAAGNRWTYLDRAGSSFGVTRVVIWDRSAKTDGLVHWAIRAHSASATLPDVNQVRSAVVVGEALECAALQWNPPSGVRPRCRGNAAHLLCR